MTRKGFLALVAIIAAGAVWYLRNEEAPPAPIRNLESEGKTIVALGDSLTAGVGADRGKDWVSLMEKRYGVQILNRGEPGDTTAGALARLDREVIAADPRIVLILIGGNDYLSRQSVDQAFANIETMILRCQQAGALVILIGLKSPTGFYEGRYRALARKHGCAYVPDILDGIFHNREMKADRLHPNNAGHALMAERIGAVAEEYL